MHKRLKWLGAMVAIIAAVFAMGIFSEPTSSDSDARSRFDMVGQSTQVLVSRQSSDGMENQDITVEAAETLGDWTIERARFHTQTILDQMDSADSVDGITGETVLVSQNGVNYVVTRIFTAGTNNAVFFMRVQNGELTRVVCQTDRGDRAVTIAGKCADSLMDEIGFSATGSI